MTIDERGRVLFCEVQHFRTWWTYLIIAVVAALGWWAFVEQILLGRPWGDKPAPDWAVWLIFALCGIGIPLLFFVARLVVEVTTTELGVNYIPFRKKRFAAGDLQGAEAVTFRPIRDWGGWGIRYSKSRGWAYTASGTRGVCLDLASGGRLTIGTQRPEDLLAALRSRLVSDPGRDDPDRDDPDRDDPDRDIT